MFLSETVSFWQAQLDAAREAKAPFQRIANQCYGFFRQSSGFMWEGEFKKRYLEHVEVPKFAVTIQKAFELVAIFGPYLFWQYPYRRVLPREQMDFPEELFVDPNDPLSQQYWQMLQMQSQREQVEAETRAQLMERYLNYSQREQPGGLSSDAQLAITDALVKGRGCLWVEEYSFPGDMRTLTGCFYDSVDNLLIDPDCRDPKLRGAKWIARKHYSPYWELEKRFNLPKGFLKGKGTIESNGAYVRQSRRRGYKQRSRQGETNDIIEWHEIFSKMGVGTRDSGFSSEYHDGFEESVGDFVYLCIAPGIEHPLNLTPEKMTDTDFGETVDAVTWPCPCYADHRWPVSLLDFYPDSNGCWPIAPLAPGLGELIAMNILLSVILEHAYEGRKQIIVGFEHALESVGAALKGSESPALVTLRHDLHRNINECIQIFQRPEMNGDPIRMLDYLSMVFDKRVGLSEYLYAVSNTQSRSATDVQSKEEKSSIRPEKMANDVAGWISEASQIEKFLATIIVSGEDLRPMLGQVGAMLWDRLISSQPIDIVAREMTASVSASDIKKPNKARESESVMSAAGFLMPLFQQYATLTGDPQPLNAFLKTFGDASNLSTEDWKMGPWVQNMPDPEVMQQQQQMQQQMEELELAGKSADVEKKQADAQKSIAELQGENAERESDLQWDQAESVSDLKMKQAEHVQKMQQSRAEFIQKMRQRRIEGNERLAEKRQEQNLRNLQKQTSQPTSKA